MCSRKAMAPSRMAWSRVVRETERELAQKELKAVRPRPRITHKNVAVADPTPRVREGLRRCSKAANRLRAGTCRSALSMASAWLSRFLELAAYALWRTSYGNSCLMSRPSY